MQSLGLVWVSTGLEGDSVFVSLEPLGSQSFYRKLAFWCWTKRHQHLGGAWPPDCNPPSRTWIMLKLTPPCTPSTAPTLIPTEQQDCLVCVLTQVSWSGFPCRAVGSNPSLTPPDGDPPVPMQLRGGTEEGRAAGGMPFGGLGRRPVSTSMNRRVRWF